MAVIDFPGFIGPSYQNIGNYPDSERSVNLYLENVESGHGKGGPVALIGTPGLGPFSPVLVPLPDAPIRCVWAGFEKLFVVAGGTLLEVFPNGSSQSFGTLNASSAPAQITSNVANSAQGTGNQLFIASGGQGYISTGVPPLIPVIPASTITFMDGYFIAAQPNSTQFNISAIGDGTSWDPLDYAVKQGSWDPISVIIAAFEQLWIFGFNTTEVWYDSGAANFPFQRIPGALLQYGCYAPFSAVEIDNSLMWLGGATDSGIGVVYRTNGLVPQRVSNHPLEYMIQNVYGTITDAVAFPYQDGGHYFYVISFPSAKNLAGQIVGATWAYDTTTGVWHERGFWNTATGQYNASLARYHAFTFNQHIVGDYRNGNLYQQSLELLTDNGAPIRRLRASPHLTDKMLWTRYDQLVLDMAVGNATQGSPQINPQMMLRWSDNGGRTWSNEKWASAGLPGKYNTRAIWRRLGRSRDRVFEVSTTDPLAAAWVAAWITADQGSGV